jgi:adenylylsulfate kinase-like enzyme
MSAKKPGGIFFITGAPGVGKSTTARALANRFEKSILFDIDYFRSLVVMGLKQPTSGWDKETELQFRLAHQAVGSNAKIYSDAGFAVIAEHCSSYEMVQEFLDYSEGGAVVCLKSTLETNLARNLMRTNKSFDPKDIEHFVLSMGDSLYLEFEKVGMTVLDNTKLEVEQAVDKILMIGVSKDRLRV